MSGKGLLSILGKGFLNPFTGISNIAKAGAGKAWGSLQQLGISSVAGYGGIFGKAGAKLFSSKLLTGVGESASFGLAGLTTALTGVAAAATAVALAYKAWEKYTPSGQLYVARKHAEEM